MQHTLGSPLYAAVCNCPNNDWKDDEEVVGDHLEFFRKSLVGISKDYCNIYYRTNDAGGEGRDTIYPTLLHVVFSLGSPEWADIYVEHFGTPTEEELFSVLGYWHFGEPIWERVVRWHKDPLPLLRKYVSQQWFGPEIDFDLVKKIS